MKYRTTIETSWQILCLLAKYGEYPQYEIPKTLGKSYRTILRHLQQLEMCRLIKVKRTEPARKKGKERKIYTLTLTGLISVLKFALQLSGEEKYVFLDILVKNYPDKLPLILGKWEFYKENGIEKIITKALEKALKKYVNPLILCINLTSFTPKIQTKKWRKLFKEMFKEKAKEKIEEFKVAQRKLDETILEFTDYVVTKYTFYSLNPLEFEKLLSISVKDEMLNKFITDMLNEEEERLKKLLYNVQKWKKNLENLGKY